MIGSMGGRRGGVRRRVLLIALAAVTVASCGGGSEDPASADRDRTTSTSVGPDATDRGSASTETTLVGEPATSTTAAGSAATSTPQPSAPTTSLAQAPSGVVTASGPEEVVWPETNVGVTLHNQSSTTVSSVVVTFKLIYEPLSGNYLFTRLLASEPLQQLLAPGSSATTSVQVCPVNADLVVEDGEQYRVDPTVVPTVTWTWAGSS